MRALLLVTGLALFAGCGSTATSQSRIPGDEPAMAEKAKAALVTLARQKPPVFLEGLDPNRLERLPLKQGDEPHTWQLGAFVINVEKRWYAADIGNLQWHQWYRGGFTVNAAGRWTAGEPEVTFADALPPPPR